MKPLVLDFRDLKKFSDGKRHSETIWNDEHSKMNLICMKPGQEIVTHTHHGSHIWIVMEGRGEFITAGKPQPIEAGRIIIVPALVEHGIRSYENDSLVLASITALGD